MKITIEKKTDQLNFEDFLGGVTRVVTIAGVKRSKAEAQYDIAIEGDNRVWRPPPTVLKLLVAAWGDDGDAWVGRRAELYGDPDVMMAGQKVGGIRVSRVSHIESPVTANLSLTRAKRQRHTVDPLPDAPPADPNAEKIAELRAEWADASVERRGEIQTEVAALSGGATANEGEA